MNHQRFVKVLEQFFFGTSLFEGLDHLLDDLLLEHFGYLLVKYNVNKCEHSLNKSNYGLQILGNVLVALSRLALHCAELKKIMTCVALAVPYGREGVRINCTRAHAQLTPTCLMRK